MKVIFVKMSVKVEVFDSRKSDNTVMFKAQLAGNKEKNGTQRDVNSSLPEVGLTYSLAIYFIYVIYKCRYFAHDSTVTSFSR